jgi:hypothetical protein
MKTSSNTSKLFGIKRTPPQKTTSIRFLEATIAQAKNPRIKKTSLEAECKKAQAITLLRQYTFIR